MKFVTNAIATIKSIFAAPTTDSVMGTFHKAADHDNEADRAIEMQQKLKEFIGA